MNEPSRPDEETADELASAYLDNEATPAECAAVEGDDALLARLEQFRAVSDGVAAAVEPMTEQQRDQMIRTAIGSGGSSRSRRDARRSAAVGRRPQRGLALAAAAAIAATAVGAFLLANLGDDDAATTVAAVLDSSSASSQDSAVAEGPAPVAPQAEMGADDAAVSPAETAAPAAADETVEAGLVTGGGDDAESLAPDDATAMADTAASTASPASADETAMSDDSDGSSEAAAAPADTEPASTTAGGTVGDTAENTAENADGMDPDGALHLGVFENIDSLVADFAGRWAAASATQDQASNGLSDAADAVTADVESDMPADALRAATEGVPCIAALLAGAPGFGIDSPQAFTAAIGPGGRLTVGGLWGRAPQGGVAIIYASAPDCEIDSRSLDSP